MFAREFIKKLIVESVNLNLGRDLKGREVILTQIHDENDERRWVRYEHVSCSSGDVHYEILWYGHNDLYLYFHDERPCKMNRELMRRKIQSICLKHQNVVKLNSDVDDDQFEVEFMRCVSCAGEVSFSEVKEEVECVFRELFDIFEVVIEDELQSMDQKDRNGITNWIDNEMLTSSEVIDRICAQNLKLNIGVDELGVLEKDEVGLWVKFHQDRFEKKVHYEIYRSTGGLAVVVHDERDVGVDDPLRKRLVELAKKKNFYVLGEDSPWCCEIQSDQDVICGRDFLSIVKDVESKLKSLYLVFEGILEIAATKGVDAIEREQCDMELEVVAQDVLGEGKESGDVVRMISNAAVADILVARGLQVPSYQRKYCWVRKQIEGLLDSIWYFPWDVTKSDERLHLGTIVLHQTTDEKNNVAYDVVDGQQRLITLSILYRLAKVKVVDVAGVGSCMPYALLSTQVPNDDVKRHIFWAARIIREWLRAHSECEKFWLQRIQLDAIIINGSQHLGKAYTFFNAINSAGKKLTDYDLLKPHHLRYLEEDEPKGYFASSWDDFVTRKVASFGGEEALLCDELMDTTLYRLRSWSRNRKVSFENHHVFSHFRAYETIGAGPRLGIERFAYDTGLGGGKLFFEYVHRFAGMYSNFVNTNAVEALHNFDGYWRHRVLLNVIRAVLFLYYCKHRDLYLDDALVFITERLSKIRAINNSLRAKKILQDSPIVSHTVEALAESPAPEFFFRYCMMPTNRYLHTGIDDENKGHVKPAFWKAVGNLYGMVSSRMAFSTSKEYSEIIKTYGLK